MKKMSVNQWQHIYNLIGAAMEVHATLGWGMAEAIYQEALTLELDIRKIGYERQKELVGYYKGISIGKSYRADIVSDGIIIELKAVSEITQDHRAQLFNYLRLTRRDIGLLINFGERVLHCEHYFYDDVEDRYVLLNKDNYIRHISR